MITVTLNGEKKQVPEKLSLKELVSYLELPAERIAVEHNREIIRRKDWETVQVRDGDSLEIVHFVGGG